jgi:hypothetical protein
MATALDEPVSSSRWRVNHLRLFYEVTSRLLVLAKSSNVMNVMKSTSCYVLMQLVPHRTCGSSDPAFSPSHPPYRAQARNRSQFELSTPL